MSTFKVDRTKASFITEKVKQRISELCDNNKMFLPYLNYPNKEMFWDLIKNEPIDVKMAIALMFDEKVDIFAGCKVFPFEFCDCRAVLEFYLPNGIEEINGVNGQSLPNLSIIKISNDNKFFSLNELISAITSFLVYPKSSHIRLILNSSLLFII